MPAGTPDDGNLRGLPGRVPAHVLADRRDHRDRPVGGEVSDALMQKMSRVRAYMLEAGYWRMETPIGETTDTLIKLAQERLHRQIGQWARVAHRRVAERAARERMGMTAVIWKFELPTATAVDCTATAVGMGK